MDLGDSSEAYAIPHGESLDIDCHDEESERGFGVSMSNVASLNTETKYRREEATSGKQAKQTLVNQIDSTTCNPFHFDKADVQLLSLRPKVQPSESLASSEIKQDQNETQNLDSPDMGKSQIITSGFYEATGLQYPSFQVPMHEDGNTLNNQPHHEEACSNETVCLAEH